MAGKVQVSSCAYVYVLLSPETGPSIRFIW